MSDIEDNNNIMNNDNNNNVIVEMNENEIEEITTNINTNTNTNDKISEDKAYRKLPEKHDDVKTAKTYLTNRLNQINRKQIPPFRLPIFYKLGGSHSLKSFEKLDSIPDSHKLNIYTWTDATFHEIRDLIKTNSSLSSKLNTNEKQILFSFYSISKNEKENEFTSKHLIDIDNFTELASTSKTISQLNLRVSSGFLDVAIYMDKSVSDVTKKVDLRKTLSKRTERDGRRDGGRRRRRNNDNRNERRRNNDNRENNRDKHRSRYGNDRRRGGQDYGPY